MDTGRIFNIQRFTVQDGPGIRTTVFTKGCPLRCPWCANPESQHSFKELGLVKHLCNQCGLCLDKCEKGAISMSEKSVQINRDICDNCGDCISVCNPRALRLLGSEVTVEEVMSEVEADRLFFRNSKGGVTVSGGEPLSQPNLVAEVFKRCHEMGIHTTLDTCGYGSIAALETVLEHTDLVLFDLKIMDSEKHLEVIKTSNEPILRNACLIAEKEVPMIIRVPLIPGITDTPDNIKAIVHFVRDLGNKTKVNVLPYHRFGISKHEMLDREYELQSLEPLQDDHVREIVSFFEEYGLVCDVIK